VKTHRQFDLEVEPGRLLRRFSEDEALKLVDQWVGIYAQNAQGANLKAYLWHTFSFGAYPSVCKREAELLYEQQIATEVVVLSNDRRSALLTDALPTKCDVMDYLVFPTNFAWSMAFTHEDGWLGPYFAKHANYDALVQQDRERAQAQRRKEQEIERAKREGWL
jgi:hypothetical protein